MIVHPYFWISHTYILVHTDRQTNTDMYSYALSIAHTHTHTNPFYFFLWAWLQRLWLLYTRCRNSYNFFLIVCHLISCLVTLEWLFHFVAMLIWCQRFFYMITNVEYFEANTTAIVFSCGIWTLFSTSNFAYFFSKGNNLV